MPRKPKRPLSEKEVEFVRTVKKLTPRGEVPGPKEMNAAAKLVYDCVPKDNYHTETSIASSIVGQKLKKKEIFEALAGLGVDEARKKFRAKMWEWLLGEDETLGIQDKDLAMKAAQLLARAMIPQEEHVVQETNVFEGRSTAEIEFYAQHGMWPEQVAQQAAELEDGETKPVMPTGQA